MKQEANLDTLAKIFKFTNFFQFKVLINHALHTKLFIAKMFIEQKIIQRNVRIAIFLYSELRYAHKKL